MLNPSDLLGTFTMPVNPGSPAAGYHRRIDPRFNAQHHKPKPSFPLESPFGTVLYKLESLVGAL